MRTGAGVDPGDPKAAVGPFFGAAVAERIPPTLVERIFCSREHIPAGAEEAAGSFEDFFCVAFWTQPSSQNVALYVVFSATPGPPLRGALDQCSR